MQLDVATVADEIFAPVFDQARFAQVFAELLDMAQRAAIVWRRLV